MAKTLFQPGKSGNPGGRPALPPEIRAQRKANQASLITLVSQLFALTPKEAKSRAKKAATTQLERAVQGLVNRSMKGDVKAFKYLMEVMLGKLPVTDWDGLTEEDLRIVQRVKEVFAEQERRGVRSAVGSGH